MLGKTFVEPLILLLEKYITDSYINIIEIEVDSPEIKLTSVNLSPLRFGFSIGAYNYLALSLKITDFKP